MGYMTLSTTATPEEYFVAVMAKLPLWSATIIAEVISDSVILGLYTKEFLTFAAKIFQEKIKSASVKDVELVTDALSSIGEVFKSTITEINNKAPKS